MEKEGGRSHPNHSLLLPNFLLEAVCSWFLPLTVAVKGMPSWHRLNPTPPEHTDLGVKQLFSLPTLKKPSAVFYNTVAICTTEIRTPHQSTFLSLSRGNLNSRDHFTGTRNSLAASQLRHSTETINLKSSCSEWHRSYGFLVDSPHPTVMEDQPFCTARQWPGPRGAFLKCRKTSSWEESPPRSHHQLAGTDLPPDGTGSRVLPRCCDGL